MSAPEIQFDPCNTKNVDDLTYSEGLAEHYFCNHHIPFKRIPRTNLKTPDYELSVESKSVIAEVKEFGRSAKTREGGYCPVPFVSRKLTDAWGQFENYGDRSCCLILSNANSMTVFLEPQLIRCAMFGEFYETVGPLAYRFSGHAAVANGKNGRVSAMVGLFPIQLQVSCLRAARRVFELTDGFHRKLTEDESVQVHRETQDPREVESAIRAVVIENRFAPNQLPEGAFSGPFDERWALDDDGVVRLKAQGDRILEMRALLPDYALRVMGVW